MNSFVKHLNKNLALSFYFFVFCLIIYLLFILAPSLPNIRSLEELWDLGHLGLFFLLTYFIFKINFSSTIFFQDKHRYFTYAGITFICALLAGATIEIVQHYVGRSASLKDILFDVVGALLGFVYCIKARNIFEKKFNIGIYCLAAICALPTLTAYVDEYYAAKQFPVISSFKYPLELLRLENNTPIELKNNQLEVKFKSKGYANIQWKFFPRDWRNFNSLILDVNNPDSSPYELNCRIHDIEHENNWSYHDRYHQEFSIRPGQQYLKIDLATAKESPANRTMDMANIASFGCFTKAQPSIRKLIFNEIRLKK